MRRRTIATGVHYRFITDQFERAELVSEVAMHDRGPARDLADEFFRRALSAR